MASSSSANDNNNNNNNNNNGEEPTEVTAATYGALDTTDVATDLWMARIPPKLAAAWEAAPEGTDLGQLIFTKPAAAAANGGNRGPQQANSSNSKKPSLRVVLSEALADSNEALPTQYTMEALTKKVPTLHPFSRHTCNGSVKLHGTVTRTCNLQMTPDGRRDGRYQQLVKNRLLSSVNSTRYVKPVEASDLTTGTTSASSMVPDAMNKGFGAAVQQFGKAKLEAESAASSTITKSSRKRRFADDQPTRSVVFELFSERPFWSVKELRATSGKSDKEIRGILQELGEFHRSGEHKGSWSLREEYQQQEKEEEEKEGGGGGKSHK